MCLWVLFITSIVKCSFFASIVLIDPLNFIFGHPVTDKVRISLTDDDLACLQDNRLPVYFHYLSSKEYWMGMVYYFGVCNT